MVRKTVDVVMQQCDGRRDARKRSSTTVGNQKSRTLNKLWLLVVSRINFAAADESKE